MNPTTRECPKCSAQVASDLKMCLTCGQPLVPQSPPPLISSVPGARPAQPAMAPPKLQPVQPAIPPQEPQPRRAIPPEPTLPYPPTWGGPSALPRTESPTVPTFFPGSIDLVLDTGQRVRVYGHGLIGRNPTSRVPGVTCTIVNDPSISKVHMEYDLDSEGLWIKDRGSTNGSTLIHDGRITKLEAHTIWYVSVGDTVTIGSRRFQIEGADSP